MHNTNFFSSSAPGRLDVMGGIADYSGSLVLQKAINLHTNVDVFLRKDYLCNISSQLTDGTCLQTSYDYRSFLRKGKPDPIYAREYFAKNKNEHWAAYILGCIIMLELVKKIDFTGADIVIKTNIPHGKGVASSAALEISVLKALGNAFEIKYQGTEIAHLAQAAENYIAGAPCGMMDQLASAFGNPSSLLPIKCQPDLMYEPVNIPQHINFLGIDSGLRHQVAGASYAEVRCAAFMGYTIIALAEGASRKDIARTRKSHLTWNLPYRGYLCNIPLNEFNSKYLSLLPDRISGKEFQDIFGETPDRITTIIPEKHYNVKICTSHPVNESYRVSQFLQFIQEINVQNDYLKIKELTRKMGTLMFESHKSYSLCGLGTQRTDEMVTMAMHTDGIVGARITGGGNGGTICLLAEGEKGLTAAYNLHQEWCQLYNENLCLFS